MASKAATWAAFGSIVKRSFGTRTLTRSSCDAIRHQQTFGNHQRQTLVSTPSRDARKIPRNHFTSNRTLREEEGGKPAKGPKAPKRKAARTQTGGASLRRVAVEAQRSRKVIQGTGRRAHVDPEATTKDVTAYCAAETYNVHVAKQVLSQEGYVVDPFHTDLYPQVLHVQTPNYALRNDETGEDELQGAGDVFVFPSGSVVTWNVPEKVAHSIVERVLPKATKNGHVDKLEAEDLEYIEDPSREHSKIVGETILLGTATTEHAVSELAGEDGQKHEIAAVLTKIAFSSALARSTKLAVLENMLNHYFETTRSIPTTLSAGSRLPFSRRFILQKTGELLNIRAQLNLYSELTDSLPDLFWDSPHELGLENYYEQVGRALDVGVRIKVLNERMDYASEIAAVLRERLSEKHSTELEWLIIFLISIEVLFEIRRLWFEWREGNDVESTEVLLGEYLRRELGKDGKGGEGRSGA